MKITIAIKDAGARRWCEFWTIVPDEAERTRFSFQMTMRSLDDAYDRERVARECEERMRLVKQTLRAEEAELARHWKAMRECKSHRAMVSATKATDRYIDDIDRIVKLVRD